MFSHIGSVLPSSLRDLSKSITSTIATQLNLEPVETRVELKNTHTPTIDVDVLLSYYAHSNEHRPSSRLLKERGGKGSRSAKLLVPGSPAFERPWRVPTNDERGGHNTPAARHGEGRSSLAPTFGAAARPKTAVGVAGRRFFRGTIEQSKGSNSHKKASDGRRNGDEQKGSSSPQQQQQQKQQQPTDVRRVSRTAEAYSETLVRGGGERSLETARSGMEETQPLPQLQLAEQVMATAEKRDSARARGNSERRENDENRQASDSHGNSSARLLQESKGLLSRRPSTAPIPFEEKLSHLPYHNDVRENGRIQDPMPEFTDCEDQATAAPGCDAAGSFSSSASHRSTRSAGGSNRSNNDSESSSFRHNPPKLRQRALPEETRHRGTFIMRAPEIDAERPPATSICEPELGLRSPVNHRPPTAEASRRPSIEVDASLSRSSRLPPPSGSLSLGSQDGVSVLTGPVTGELGHGNNTDGRASGAQDIGGYLAVEASAGGKGTGVDIAIMGLTTPSTRRKGGVRSSRDRGGEGERRAKSTLKRRFHRQRGRRQQGQQTSPAAGTGCIHSTSGRPRLPGSRASPAAALAQAMGTTWTRWRRPGDLGELDLQADLLHCTNKRGGRRQVLGRATNGAAAGVGWGGKDQMMWVAAAPKASSFVGREKHGTPASDPVEEQRPDTRERFYCAPVEHLKAMHPCFRCFDALMHHFRGGVEGDALGRQPTWSSAAAARDPHVALFVRWESLDQDLGRYIPRGFVGSFTPRPFRPALAEYAIRAAKDPKFWGLGWPQIPDTRCRVVVVKSLEVAQHEMDWLSNRHGLILSFDDAAGRHYQAVMFPETLCRAGWKKGDTIDALYRKAGYRGKRPHTQINTPESGEGGTADQDDYAHDPVVARTAMFLRFETVSFRMEYCKYQRAKAAAAQVTTGPPN